MENKPTFVAVDPVTDQVLWICSGPDPRGDCPLAENPPYVCQGLKLVATQGTNGDGASLVVERPMKGGCPAVALL